MSGGQGLGVRGADDAELGPDPAAYGRADALSYLRADDESLGRAGACTDGVSGRSDRVPDHPDADLASGAGAHLQAEHCAELHADIAAELLASARAHDVPDAVACPSTDSGTGTHSDVRAVRDADARAGADAHGAGLGHVAADSGAHGHTKLRADVQAEGRLQAYKTFDQPGIGANTSSTSRCLAQRGRGVQLSTSTFTALLGLSFWTALSSTPVGDCPATVGRRAQARGRELHGHGGR